jgi:zinc transporter
MNVKGIPYAEESWAFWGVFGVCMLLGLAVLGFFIRAQWVRGR